MKGSEENVHYPNSDGTRVKESTCMLAIICAELSLSA